MTRHLAAVLIVVLASISATFAPAFAQGASAGSQERDRLDVARLPIDLERIHRELRRAEVRDESEGLNIRFVVDVFGQAPVIDLFTAEDNLVHGPVPYGAPTHQEVLQHLTPREFRSPPADLTALLRWLADRAASRDR